MKKIVFIAALVSIFNFQFSICHAQWGDYGVKAGLGYASITDDLSTKSPIVGANLGGYINLNFTKSQTVLGEIFYLQTGLNLVRRGSNFQVVLDHETTISIREGYYHAYYLQLPFLACVHMELPIRKAGHVVGVYAGPAVSVGVFGVCRDRMVAPFLPSHLVNYDSHVTGTAADRAVFNHLSRLDISALIGLTYEYKDFSVSLSVDHGFVATSKEEDILRIIENSQSGSGTPSTTVEIPNGNNVAFLLTIGYRLGNFSE